MTRDRFDVGAGEEIAEVPEDEEVEGRETRNRSEVSAHNSDNK